MNTNPFSSPTFLAAIIKESHGDYVLIQENDTVTVIPDKVCVGVVEVESKTLFSNEPAECTPFCVDGSAGTSYITLNASPLSLPPKNDETSDCSKNSSSPLNWVGSDEKETKSNKDNKDTKLANEHVYVGVISKEAETMQTERDNKRESMNDGRHHCIVCTKHYADRKALRRHSRLHDPEYRGCYVCGKKFTRKTFLEDHIRIHTGEKPFGCHNCGKFFRCKRNLAQHKLKHTQVRFFPCSHCANVYRSKQSLRYHVNTKHK